VYDILQSQDTEHFTKCVTASQTNKMLNLRQSQIQFKHLPNTPA